MTELLDPVVTDVLDTPPDDTEELGGSPSPGTKKDKRLKQNQPSVADREALQAEVEQNLNTPPQWQGVLVVEDQVTGDGREFAPDSITWQDPPIPLRWQKSDSHGGMPTNVTVSVGSITRIWRDGSNIMGEGHFDLGGPEDDDAHEAFRRMSAATLTGVSIDADDISDADIEYVFPEPAEDEEDDIFFLLFAMPEKMIFHAGRIRAATLCDIPAFVEAQLHLIEPGDSVAASAALVSLGAVAPHSTATSDNSWDAAANEKKLPSPMPVGTAKNAYAWIDDSAVSDGEIPKSGGKFIHHEVSGDGKPGAANLTACSSGIGILHGGRGGTTIPSSDQRGVYDHLARHLRDAGQEPPPYDSAADAIIASAWFDEWVPSRSWFENPNLGQVMPIIVTDQGRVYGYAAQWGECHIGYLNECIMPPRSDDFTRFMTGEQPVDDGTRVIVGTITAGLTHAPLSWGANRANEHYENTDAIVAHVRVGNDRRGIWVAGAVPPWAQTARVNSLRASGQVSPDWRRISGQLKMVGLLTVNESGYQTPRVKSHVASGELRTLIASGMVTVQHPQPSEDELNARALNLLRAQLVKRVHPGHTD